MGVWIVVSKAQRALDWPVYRPHDWGKCRVSRGLGRPWWGLDTERDAESGEFVCCWGVREDGDVKRFGGLEELEKGTYWIWNLGYDVEGLLRDLDIDEGWAAKVDGARFMLKGGKGVYFHGKQFCWNGPNGVVRLVEASSFWGKVPLRVLGAKGGVDAGKMNLGRYMGDGEYRKVVDDYCVQDARIVIDNILRLEEGVRGLGVELGSSPGATARGFMNRMGGYPRVIWKTHKDFLRAYGGGRFEITKRGDFEGPVYQYDIASAYWWALTQCPWLTDGAYHRNVREVGEGALYGVYRVGFDTDEYLGLAPKWRGGIRVYSAGEEACWLTKPEVEWLRGRGHEVDVHRGVEIYDDGATDLWARVFRELFRLKKSNDDNPVRDGAKTVGCSIYGILIQLVRKAGEWGPIDEVEDPVDFAGELALSAGPRSFQAGGRYAPVYASTLTGLTRVKLVDAAVSLEPEDYIGGHTDSIVSLKPLKKDLGDELGQWKLEIKAESASVCKTGMYSLNRWDFGEMGALGSKMKMRGITRDGMGEMLWAEKFTRKQRIGIKRAKNWGEVSLIRKAEVANNYNVEKKRDWVGRLKRGAWIDSKAYRMIGG
jgi:hypothetical protein